MTQGPQLSVCLGEVLTFKVTPVGKRNKISNAYPCNLHLCSNKHYLCISAPAMPLPPLEPMPGPGHYNVVDYEGPPKHYMSSSAFVSTTSRWSGGAPGEEDVPGPGMFLSQPLMTVMIVIWLVKDFNMLGCLGFNNFHSNVQLTSAKNNFFLLYLLVSNSYNYEQGKQMPKINGQSTSFS